HSPAEHVTVDVRRHDQAPGPVRHRPAGARPEPAMAAGRQRAEEVRAQPRAAPVDLAVVPLPGLLLRRERLPQVPGGPAELVPLPAPAASGSCPRLLRRPGENGHTSTVSRLTDNPGIAPVGA